MARRQGRATDCCRCSARTMPGLGFLRGRYRVPYRDVRDGAARGRGLGDVERAPRALHAALSGRGLLGFSDRAPVRRCRLRPRGGGLGAVPRPSSQRSAGRCYSRSSCCSRRRRTATAARSSAAPRSSSRSRRSCPTSRSTRTRPRSSSRCCRSRRRSATCAPALDQARWHWGVDIPRPSAAAGPASRARCVVAR